MRAETKVMAILVILVLVTGMVCLCAYLRVPNEADLIGKTESEVTLLLGKPLSVMRLPSRLPREKLPESEMRAFRDKEGDKAYQYITYEVVFNLNGKVMLVMRGGLIRQMCIFY